MALGIRTYRPLITGAHHIVSSGHYLATAAGFRILEQGGNATDAGVAAGIAINVTLPQWTSFGGVAPIIIHDAASGETVSISGLGRWPKAASIDHFNQNCGGEIPTGVLRTVTPRRCRRLDHRAEALRHHVLRAGRDARLGDC